MTSSRRARVRPLLLPAAACLLAVAGGAAVGAPGPFAQEPDPIRILQDAAVRYDALHGFCADFSQERVVPLLNQTTRSRGTLCQMDPAYLRMDFSEPDGDRVVADGEHLWMYYPSVNPDQVVRTRLGGARGRTFDFQSEFLDDPDRRFEARYEGRDTVTGRETHLLVLRPKEEGQGYVEARTWVEAERGLIRKVEIEEENGSVRRVVLSDIRTDPGLEPSRFRFDRPPDVRVIERRAPGAPR